MQFEALILSDLHGNLPAEIPTSDVVIIAGDLGPATRAYHRDGRAWIDGTFRPWLIELSRPVIGIAGNHDFVAQEHPELMRSLPWTYLCDSGVDFEGLQVFGSPWAPHIGNWAFMASEDELSQHWELIPSDVDFLITHTPPHGILDESNGNQHCGSSSLLYQYEKPNPITPHLHVFGHIHEQGGQRIDRFQTQFVNAAYLNRRYKPEPERIGTISCRLQRPSHLHDEA